MKVQQPTARLHPLRSLPAVQWDGTTEGAVEIADWLGNPAFVGYIKKNCEPKWWVACASDAVLLIPEEDIGTEWGRET